MIKRILRALPVFKGKQRLARLLFKSDIENAGDVVFTGRYDCIYKIPNLKENICFELFINGVYEKDTIDFIFNKLPLNGKFIDIGAKIGAICLPICKQRSDIEVVAIEASSKVFSYLRSNIEANTIKNCISINKAISDTDGETVIFFSPDNLYGKGSMAAVFSNIAEEIETITIDTVMTTGQFSKADLIKIDVEGYEYFAFKGAEMALKKNDAPGILFEFVDWAEALAKDCKPGDAQKLLLQYGYHLWEVNEKGLLIPILSPVIKGSIMIWASKNKENV